MAANLGGWAQRAPAIRELDIIESRRWQMRKLMWRLAKVLAQVNGRTEACDLGE